MVSTKDCVPAGTLAHAIAGDVPSPGAAPGAAWLNFTGISPPSGKPVTVSVIAGPAGAAGAAPRWPAGACAVVFAAANRTNRETMMSVVGLMLRTPGALHKAVVSAFRRT